MPSKALPQSDTSGTSLADTVKSVRSDHSFYASAGYGSNMIYLGSTISQDQPYGYGALTYGYNDNLFLTLSAVHLHDQNPFIAFSSGSINYTHTFNSWFDISASLSGYLVARSLADTLFGNFIYGDLTFGVDWRLLYTKISAGGLVMDGINPYLQLRNSRFFKTPEFSKKKLYFTFDPYINVMFGSLTKAETKDGTTVTISPPYRKKGKNPQGSSSYTNYSTVFGLMEIDFGLPVSFNAGRFTIETEPDYIIPLYDGSEYQGMKGFVFQLSVYFRIF